MASYTLIGNVSTTQVLTPTVSQDAEIATIQTIPSNVVATIVVSEIAFSEGQAGPELTTFADNIEELLGSSHATGATGTSTLDDNGLTQYFVTFTVTYNPTPAAAGNVTADVDVPVTLLNVEDAALGATLVDEARTMIEAAYTNLVKMSEG